MQSRVLRVYASFSICHEYETPYRLDIFLIYWLFNHPFHFTELTDEGGYWKGWLQNKRKWAGTQSNHHIKTIENGMLLDNYPNFKIIEDRYTKVSTTNFQESVRDPFDLNLRICFHEVAFDISLSVERK